ncbi:MULTISPECIES: hypothetical protein [Virgibacillus]|uniref:Uncharacterized protein n=2 Tax=Virgibacillus TaxID=84406 RepID=A0A024QA03_9BACI|nr:MULTISPECIES: hypothetical protein [Virgibacillus]EQB35716.1 hypothetical protein M948_11785 [Virgibacillus sp. CM-4]MYL41519.1 hypothetical protein [Virgibacillus massiliensis]GGJ50284.1 hypothetical protein GCM10007111_10640 [Virgibacillus kapii]CDQ39324.1 hypothetical protein BN990_01619 [Virgibacillus massiliensis]
MLVMDHREMRDEKIARLKQGNSAYAESRELIRLVKRGIEKEHLDVFLDEASSGCWFIPNSSTKSS